MAFVTIRIKGTEGYTRQALGKDRMVLGRSSECDISVRHASISREHCTFIREGETWSVEDAGSANGTWVNKDKLTTKLLLSERDIVKAGKARLTFHAGEMGDADAAVELNTADDDDHDPDGSDAAADEPARPRDPNAPPDAAQCPTCSAWMSVVHRHKGEHMNCPRCGHSLTVAAR
jgi:predicted component of type VI protein secretion system